MHPNEIDTLLTMSDPARSLTARERQLTAAMADQSAPVRSRIRFSRSLALSGLVALLLGGGGAVAAAATGLWDGWAQDDAIAILEYELPSGASCEMRIGNVQGAPDEVSNVIRDALTGLTLDDAAVVAAAGHETGDPLTSDALYQDGVNGAVVQRVEEALTAQNLTSSRPIYFAQGVCQ